MDIKAAQAEGITKAAAWLEQNLQVEEVTPSVPPPPAQGTPPAPPASPPAEPPAEPVAPKPGLTDAIRQDREKRAAASNAAAEAAKYKGELETLRKENEGLRVAGAATDPFEFLRHRKLTKEQQALWGQAFLYDLKPEVAPQEFRLELYKAEQARKEQEKVEAAQREAAEQAQQRERAHLDRYADELVQHVQSSAGSSPESEMWFSEEGPDGQLQLNHRVYAQSLLATADNLARRAQQTGQQADLSPANIARVLEAEVSKRMQRRDAKRASKAPTEQKQVKPAVPAQGGMQATNTTTTSASGLGGGPPLPPARTDEERRARAVAALFGTK
jgi:hypothetical protein